MKSASISLADLSLLENVAVAQLRNSICGSLRLPHRWQGHCGSDQGGQDLDWCLGCRDTRWPRHEKGKHDETLRKMIKQTCFVSFKTRLGLLHLLGGPCQERLQLIWKRPLPQTQERRQEEWWHMIYAAHAVYM